MIRFITWLLRKLYEFKYRKADDDVCCCGSSNCDSDWSHSYTNAKHYAIESAIKNKLTEYVK